MFMKMWFGAKVKEGNDDHEDSDDDDDTQFWFFITLRQGIPIVFFSIN